MDTEGLEDTALVTVTEGTDIGTATEDTDTETEDTDTETEEDTTTAAVSYMYMINNWTAVYIWLCYLRVMYAFFMNLISSTLNLLGIKKYIPLDNEWLSLEKCFHLYVHVCMFVCSCVCSLHIKLYVPSK